MDKLNCDVEYINRTLNIGCLYKYILLVDICADERESFLENDPDLSFAMNANFNSVVYDLCQMGEQNGVIGLSFTSTYGTLLDGDNTSSVPRILHKNLFEFFNESRLLGDFYAQDNTGIFQNDVKIFNLGTVCSVPQNDLFRAVEIFGTRSTKSLRYLPYEGLSHNYDPMLVELPERSTIFYAYVVSVPINWIGYEDVE